jgi:hypothetical protein
MYVSDQIIATIINVIIFAFLIWEIYDWFFSLALKSKAGQVRARSLYNCYSSYLSTS